MALQSTVAKTASLKGDFGSAKCAGAPATFYLAFFTDATMATELTGTGGITRTAITNNDTNFTTTSGVTVNALAINSSTSTGSWGSASVFAALMDAASAGNAWDGGAITSLSVSASGTVLQVAAGALSISA